MNRKILLTGMVLIAIIQGSVYGQSGYVLPYTTGFWHFADDTTPRRVRCSAVAPDGSLYVISETHPDLFCSKDDGATWENIKIGSGDFLLKTLAISAKGDIYVGGADEFKLYRSDDSGETWQAVQDSTLDCRILRIYIDPKDRLAVITCNNIGGDIAINCYRSNDYGIHWTLLGEGISCLAFFDGKLYAGTQGISDYYWVKGGAILISMDDGDTWTTIDSPTGYPILDLMINSRGIIFAHTGGTDDDHPAIWLTRSRDNGNTWQKIPGLWGASMGRYGSDGQLLCNAEGDLFARGYYLARSNDDGDTWTNLSVNGSNILLDNSQKLLVFGQLGHDPEIHSINSSLDNGDSWTLIHSGIGLAMMSQYRILVTPDGHVYAAVGNSFRKNLDNGKTWPFSTIMPLKMNNYATALVRHPSGYLYVATSLDGIYRSVDDGDHWQRISIGTADSSFSTMAIGQNGYIYAAGEQSDISYLYVSIDNGNNWQRKKLDQDKPFINFVKLCSLDAEKVLLATARGGYMYWSSDDGDTWTTEKIDLTNYTWDEIWDVIYDPTSQYIILVTNSGLYRRQSTEFTSAWEKIENGLPNTIEGGSIIFAEETLLLSWREGRELNTGAVYNFYYSKDHGNHWTIVDDRAPVFSGCVPSMAIHPGGYVYAGLAVVASEGCESDLFFCSAPFIKATPVIAEKHLGITPNPPIGYKLLQNYPNPFNPSTTIEITLSKPEKVSVCVFSIRGELIAELVNGPLPAGTNKVKWNTTSQSNGIYFIFYEAGDYREMLKTVLIK